MGKRKGHRHFESASQPPVYRLFAPTGPKRWYARAEPSENSSVIGTFKNGDFAKIAGRYGDYLILDDYSGYILERGRNPSNASHGWYAIAKCEHPFKAELLIPQTMAKLATNKRACHYCQKIFTPGLLVHAPCGHCIHATCIGDFLEMGICPVCERAYFTNSIYKKLIRMRTDPEAPNVLGDMISDWWANPNTKFVSTQLFRGVLKGLALWVLWKIVYWLYRWITK